MVRQELTGSRETGWTGKPHPEQDQIEGQGHNPVISCHRQLVCSARLMPPGWLLDPDGNIRARWMATTLSEGTEPGLEVYQPHVQPGESASEYLDGGFHITPVF